MATGGKFSALYRWKRRGIEDPVEVPPQQDTASKIASLTAADNRRKKDLYDINSWLKKIETATDDATLETFGTDSSTHRRPPKYKTNSNDDDSSVLTTQTLQEHDTIQEEARSLLNKWMVDNLTLDSDSEEHEEVVRNKTVPSRSKNNSQLMGLIEQTDYPQDSHSAAELDDMYTDIERKYDLLTVDDVLSRLLDKPLVGLEVTNDLGIEKKKPNDPTLTMDARHKQVKENREKRNQMLAKKRENKIRSKDVELSARQIVQREEKDKARKFKIEDEEVQKEMVKIRKEMTDRQNEINDNLIRQRVLREAAEEQLKLQIETEDEEKKLEEIKTQHKMELRQRYIIDQLKHLQVLEYQNEMKLLQKCFSAWMKIVIDRRLVVRRAKAMADWKLMLRTWNNWRKYTLSLRHEREAKEHERSIKEAHWKQQLVVGFHARKVLRHSFTRWLMWVDEQRQTHRQAESQAAMKNKISTFLASAASGKLRNQSSVMPSTGSKENNNIRRANSMAEFGDQSECQRKKVDQIFSAEPKQRRLSSGNLPEKSEQFRSDPRSGKSRKPSQPWQVTAKHTKLPVEELATLGLNNTPQRRNIARQLSEARTTKQQENQKIYNQKLMEGQQKQLKEQQKMIEQLQKTIVTQAGSGNRTEQNLESTQDLRSAVKLELPLDDEKPQKTTDNGLKGRLTRMDPLVRAMEEREAERTRRKELLEEKRRQKEQEKLERMRAEETELQRQADEEKRVKLTRLKQQEMIQKQKDLEKQQRLEFVTKKNKIADEHYHCRLLTKYGLTPWKNLIAISSENKRKSETHFHGVLLRKVFPAWHMEVRETLMVKGKLADQLRRNQIIRRCFCSWKRIRDMMRLQQQRACRHRRRALLKQVFTAWMNFTVDEKLSEIEKHRTADEHNLLRIQAVALRVWKKFPSVVKQEKLRMERISSMRSIVSNILPDYQDKS